MSEARARHRFFVEPEQVEGERVSFTPTQARQMRSVLRLRPGAKVVVFDGRGPGGWLVEVEALEAAGGWARRLEPVPLAAEPRTRVVAYPALTGRERFETALQKLVEVGAAAIAPVLTERVLVRRPPDAAREARWRAILREAAEQSGRPLVPPLRPTLALDAALAQAAAEGDVLLAYEVGDAAQPLDAALGGLRSATADAPRTVSLFVGPEGGYAAAEVERARAAGARVVSLGSRILRTETASPVFTALVLFGLGDL